MRLDEESRRGHNEEVGMAGYTNGGISLFPTDGTIAELQRIVGSTVDFSTDLPLKRLWQSEAEKRLAAAVLSLAIRDWIGKVDGSAVHYKDRSSLNAWFKSPDTDYLYSFLNICETLELPALKIRRLLFADNSSVRVPHRSPVVGDRCRVMVA